MESVSQEHREELRNWIKNANYDNLDAEHKYLHDMLTMDRSDCSGFRRSKPDMSIPLFVFIVIFSILGVGLNVEGHNEIGLTINIVTFLIAAFWNYKVFKG